ncbi:hypothetical protein M1558_00120 [Candidatus Parvarchaeota archaeon]|nr:hypothetical protein [Candidatus Parvarchaeota archaeon]
MNESLSKITYNLNNLISNLNSSILLLNSSIKKINSSLLNVSSKLNSSVLYLNKSLNKSINNVNKSLNYSLIHLNLVVSSLNSTVLSNLDHAILLLNKSINSSFNYSFSELDSIISNVNKTLLIEMNNSLRNLNLSIAKIIYNISLLSSLEHFSSNSTVPLVIKNNTVILNSTTKNITEFKEYGLPYGTQWKVEYDSLNKSSNSNLIYFINFRNDSSKFTVPNVVLGGGSCSITYLPSPSSGTAPIDTLTEITFKQVSYINSSQCVDEFSSFNSTNNILRYSVGTNYPSTVIITISTGHSSLPNINLPENCQLLQSKGQAYIAYCIEGKGNYSINLNDNNPYEIAKAYVFNGTYYSFASSSSSGGYYSTLTANLANTYPLVLCAGGSNSGFSVKDSYQNITQTAYSAIWNYYNGSSCSIGVTNSGGSVAVLGLAPNATAPSIQSLTTTFTETGLNSGLYWSVTYNGFKKYLNGNTIQFSNPVDNVFNYSIPDVYSSVDGCNITFVPSVTSGSLIVGGSLNVNFVPFESCIKFTPYFAEGSNDAVLNYSIKTKGSSTVLLSLTNGNSGVVGFNVPNNCVLLQKQSYNVLYYCIEGPGDYSINLNTQTGSNELAAAYVFNGTGYSIDSSSNYNNYYNNYNSNFGSGLQSTYPLVFCSMGGNNNNPFTQNGTVLSSSNSYFWYYVDSSSCNGETHNTASIIAFSVINASVAPSATNLDTTFTETGLNSGLYWSVTYNGFKKYLNGNTIQFSNPVDNVFNYSIPDVYSSVDGCNITFVPSVTSGSLIVGGSLNVNFVPFESCIKFTPYFAEGSNDAVLNYSIKTKGSSTVLLSLTNGNSGVVGFNVPNNCVLLQKQSYNVLYYCIEGPGDYSINLNTQTGSNELAAAYVFNGTGYSIDSSSNYNNYYNNYNSNFGSGLQSTYPLVFCSMGGNNNNPFTQNGTVLSSSNSYFWYYVDSSSCNGETHNTASIIAFSVINASVAPSATNLDTTFTETGLNLTSDWKVTINNVNFNATSSILHITYPIDEELNYSIPDVVTTHNNCTVTFKPSIVNGSIISGGSVSVKFNYNQVC